MDVTDEQWELLRELIVEPPRRPDKKGRPRVKPRPILNGILWILRTGAPWKDLPDRYPSYQACHRRFQEWSLNGTLKNTLGPHHNGPVVGRAWPHMFRVAPETGPPPGKKYHTLGYGLFEPFVLKNVTR